jgi:hypothetical protein
MLDRPAHAYLHAQRAAQRMRELTALRRNGILVDALLADHGIYHFGGREARDVKLSFGQTPALRGASVTVSTPKSWPSWDPAARTPHDYERGSRLWATISAW